MTKILLDTNAYVRFLRGDEKVLDSLARAETVFMSVFVLGELLAGFRAGASCCQAPALTSKRQLSFWAPKEIRIPP